MDVSPRSSGGGKLTASGEGWRLWIPGGDARHYRLAQLDDQGSSRRRDYPRRPPFTLRLRARASSASSTGTWGFGIWNDPYGFPLSAAWSTLRFPALPQAAWFFYASPSSYLSLRNDKAASGFFAQVFASRRSSLALVRAAAAFPFSRKTARRILGRVIAEDSAPVVAVATDWNEFKIEWKPAATAFWVNTELVLETRLTPAPPLGLILWIDNQFAGFDPDGRLRWGLESASEPAWIDIQQASHEP